VRYKDFFDIFCAGKLAFWDRRLSCSTRSIARTEFETRKATRRFEIYLGHLSLSSSPNMATILIATELAVRNRAVPRRNPRD
jgi:hypothetical protein